MALVGAPPLRHKMASAIYAGRTARRARRHLRTPPAGLPHRSLACRRVAALLDALSEERSEDAARLLAPLPPVLNSSKGVKVDEVDNPPVEGCEGDTDTFDHPRIWRTWDTEEWRTDFPPPPGFFAGHEEGDWEDEGYCGAGDDESAAMIAAGIADRWSKTAVDEEVKPKGMSSSPAQPSRRDALQSRAALLSKTAPAGRRPPRLIRGVSIESRIY